MVARLVQGVIVAGVLATSWSAAGLGASSGSNDDADMIINGLSGTLNVTPGIIKLTARPGQTLNLQLTVSNGTKTEQTASVTPEDIVAGPQDMPLLALHKSAPAHSSIKGWIGGLGPLDLAPGAQQVYEVSIAVPANAEPGSHVGAVRVVSAPAGSAAKGQSAPQGALIFLRVQGPALNKLVLSKLDTGRVGGDRQLYSAKWFAALPVILSANLHNVGNVHLEPKGTLNISDMFGHVVTKLPFSTDGDILLPGGSGQISQLVTGKYRPGLYLATVQIPYGQGQQLVAKTSFWVVPIWVWGVALAGFLGLYAAAVWLIGRRGRDRTE